MYTEEDIDAESGRQNDHICIGTLQVQVMDSMDERDTDLSSMDERYEVVRDIVEWEQDKTGEGKIDMDKIELHRVEMGKKQDIEKVEIEKVEIEKTRSNMIGR